MNSSIRINFAIGGLLLFVFGIIGVLVIVLLNFSARQRDSIKFDPSIITITPITITPDVTNTPSATHYPATPSYTYDPPGHLISITGKDCEFHNIDLKQRIMSEAESQSLVIELINENSTTSCVKTIEIQAPNFDISPIETRQTITSSVNIRSASAVWTITPRKVGDFEITIRVNDGTNLVLGITVTNMFGLHASTIQFLSWLGTVLGPMLSIPWWYEKIIERRKNKADKAQKGSTKKTGQKNK